MSYRDSIDDFLMEVPIPGVDQDQYNWWMLQLVHCTEKPHWHEYSEKFFDVPWNMFIVDRKFLPLFSYYRDVFVSTIHKPDERLPIKVEDHIMVFRSDLPIAMNKMSELRRFRGRRIL